MATTELGDITLNGKPYRIDIQSWRSKDLADFSPRASTPGGSVQQSELLLYQPLEQTDFRHGFGFFWFTDAMGYTQTSGNIDTRNPGTAMLYTTTTATTEADTGVKRKFVVFNNILYSIGNKGIRKCTTGSPDVWSEVPAGAGAVVSDINDALATETYLFFCPNGARIQKMTTAEVVSDAGVNANATDFKWLVIHKGNIYAGKDSSNQVHYDSNVDLSQLMGDAGAVDPNVINVGFSNMPTIGAISFGGFLYVAKRDGLYQIGDDRIARKMLDFSTDGNADSNFVSMEVYNGYLYFIIGKNIYQWNGARLVPVTPPGMQDTYPYNKFSYLRNLRAIGGYLYATGCYLTAAGTSYEHCLICHDGVGWHKLMDIKMSATAYIPITLGYNYYNQRLYIYYAYGTAPVVYYTYYIPFTLTGLPYENFSTATGTHYLETSRMDLGYRRVKKSTPSLLVEASNMVSSDSTNIAVAYSLDGAAYTTWGNVTANGFTELTSPGSNRTVEYNYIKLKFTLSTGLATRTPVLESYTLRFIMRPNIYYGWNFTVVSAKDLEYGGHGQNKSPAEIKADLETARDSKSPVELVDIWGTSHYGYISSLTEQAMERHEDEMENSPNIEGIFNVNFVEVA